MFRVNAAGKFQLFITFYTKHQVKTMQKSSKSSDIWILCRFFSIVLLVFSINPHAFRHTLASVLCQSGIDIVTISKWLGHKNVTTTMNIYEHILEKGKEQVISCVSDVILGKGNVILNTN